MTTAYFTKNKKSQLVSWLLTLPILFVVLIFISFKQLIVFVIQLIFCINAC
jgi:hypothetical protein